MKKYFAAKNLEISFIAVFTVFLLVIALKANDLSESNDKKTEEVLATSNVTVNAGIFSCILNLNVKPEKRIPAINNWQTTINVEIYDQTDTLKGTFTTNTNNLGDATVDLCSLGINLTGGNYDLYVKGFSHLRKKYDNINGFNFPVATNITLSAELLSGETSTVYDNFINVLDVSSQVSNLESSTNQFDLNQDTEVNTLDISNTVTNFYISGDCSPNEIANNICD